MPRILVYGGCTITSELKREQTQLWSRVMTRLNPGCDFLLIDTASVIDPATFVEPGIMIERFADNPGHLAHGGKDGAGRAFITGIERATAMGYDYAVSCETDLIFTRPVFEVVGRMAKCGVRVACLQMPFYQFFEWGFSVYNIAWTRQTEFIKRYDWQNAPAIPIPEQRLEWLCGDDLFVLPYRGIRNSQHWVDAQTLAGLFPYGPPDWFHDNAATDMSVMLAFLKLNGIEA